MKLNWNIKRGGDLILWGGGYRYGQILACSVNERAKKQEKFTGCKEYFAQLVWPSKGSKSFAYLWKLAALLLKTLYETPAEPMSIMIDPEHERCPVSDNPRQTWDSKFFNLI